MTILILRDKLNDMESIYFFRKLESSVFGIEALMPRAFCILSGLPFVTKPELFSPSTELKPCVEVEFILFTTNYYP